MPHPALAFLSGRDPAPLEGRASRRPQAPTSGLGRRASLSALLLSPWLMPSLWAQALGPVPSGEPSGVQLALPWPLADLRKVFGSAKNSTASGPFGMDAFCAFAVAV